MGHFLRKLSTLTTRSIPLATCDSYSSASSFARPALVPQKYTLLFFCPQKRSRCHRYYFLSDFFCHEPIMKSVFFFYGTNELKKELEQFVYVASHDLKQPIASIYSWSQLLQVRFGDRLEEKGLGYLASMQNSIKQMTQLLDDLLSYSRVERANSDFVMVNCEIIVHQVLSRLSPAIAATQAKITINELPEIYGNPIQLRQLFHHLLDNALKFQEGATVPIITLSAEDNKSHWIFRCSDNGIGIEPDYQSHIFNAFKRLHPQTKYSGSGLGLAVCKKILQRHGGQIWVESTYGNGSTFLFSLPISPIPIDSL